MANTQINSDDADELADDESKETKEQEDKEILEIARKRFDLAVTAEADIRREALDDLKFRSGEQWPEDIKRSRDLDKRPCLTINRLPQFIRQITNDQRQNRPSIKVSPVDDKADIETAKIYQGIIRHIEYNSNADVAYDTAFEGAATKGIGYFRILTDYCDKNSFDQEIFIKRIRNSFSVYLDPSYQEPDASDANWGFIFEDISKDDYKSQYKNSKMASMTDWKSVGDKQPGWVTEDSVRIAEYFYKTHEEVTLCLLNTKEVIEKSKLPEILPDGIQVVSERQTVLPAIKWCKINAVEVLEQTDWPGLWIPIIPVLGDELDVDGKKILEGVIRHAKDPQRMYNYWASSETETIALAPRAPFIGVEGQFEGFEEQWRTANVKNHSYLQYKAKTIGGVLAGPPTRQVYEPPVQAITQARMQSSEDLKATTGIYDASLGNRSNENSGIAIQRRNSQAQTNNFHFIDNLSRALRHSGRILLDLIPKVYDTARVVRTLGEDEKIDMVLVNQIFEKNGESVQYNLGTGKYDVTISTGPAFATKRQEAAQDMLEFTKAVPNAAPIISDLIARNMDWPGAEQIADRLKKTLPPGVAEKDENEKQQLPPEAQQQMQQMDQMIQQLTTELNKAHDILDQKTVELESKERIEFAKINANIEIELARIGSKEAQVLLAQEVSAIRHRLELLGINEPIENESNENETEVGVQNAVPPQDQPSIGGQMPVGE